MIQNLKRITCDECLRRYSTHVYTVSKPLLLDANSAIDQAAGLGWYMDGETELCPLHAKEAW